MLRVVRTRRVRALEERFYGRTARVFMVGVVDRTSGDVPTFCVNALTEAAVESVPAHEADTLRTISRHVRIPESSAREFWDRVIALSQEFAQLPRAGDTVFGFAAGLYPTDHPTLPEPELTSTPIMTRSRRRSRSA
jgi:hypothetical protein